MMQSIAEVRALQSASRAQLRAWQNERLRTLLKELPNNPFYAQKFQAAGLPMTAVAHVADLSRLPFTTKGELAEEQLAYPPYGRLLTYSLSAYRFLHQTSGTTGRSLKWLDTAADWENFLRCWAEVYRGAGVTENDLVFCAFSFGPYISHWTGIDGARYVGALALSGGGMGSEQRLRAIIENRCTVLVCTPTYALHLAEVAARIGIDLPASDIRLTVHAGEPGASVPNVKRRIEAAWGARCFDHAGATEVGAWAFDCLAEDGAMHLNELEFIFEVIDPQTAAPVAEGVRGELVITTLSRPGMPVLRYRTGDLVELTTEPCACGRTLARIKGGVLGRADDMLSVRGVNVYPAAIDNLLKALPSVVEYEVEIRRVEEMDDLLLKVETSGEVAFAEIERAIRTSFRTQLNIRVNVEQAPPLSLPRYEFKARRFRRMTE
jgi:phenylacetate-CoA ligase